MSRAQLSMSIARANHPRIAVASTAHTVDGPRTGAATPITKKSPAPSWAIASAAAFHTETNDSTAGVESTTRTGYGVRSRGVNGMRAPRVFRRGCGVQASDCRRRTRYGGGAIEFWWRHNATTERARTV
jgi:hypothetical protein